MKKLILISVLILVFSVLSANNNALAFPRSFYREDNRPLIQANIAVSSSASISATAINKKTAQNNALGINRASGTIKANNAFAIGSRTINKIPIIPRAPMNNNLTQSFRRSLQAANQAADYESLKHGLIARATLFDSARHDIAMRTPSGSPSALSQATLTAINHLKH